MELIKDIYFNTDKLVENTNVKVSYTGKFYQGNNNKVFIHYGYGKNWDNVQEVEMKKTDLGYQTEVNLAGNETINFCFKNQNNEWDNNLGKNYVFKIEKAAANNLESTSVDEVEKSLPNSFFKKTFSNKNSNVYFNAEIEPANKNNVEQTIVSGVAENIAYQTPNNYNSVIDNTTNLGTASGVLSGKELASAINPELSTNLDIGVETGITNEYIAKSSINNSNNTALMIRNSNITNYFAWTNKVKETVCKFLASVPRFISGNYKRIVEKYK